MWLRAVARLLAEVRVTVWPRSTPPFSRSEALRPRYAALAPWAEKYDKARLPQIWDGGAGPCCLR